MPKRTAITRASGPPPRSDEEPLELGQWWWIKGSEREWLGCVTHLGTNYAEFTSVSSSYDRIHFDNLAAELVRRELEPDAFFKSKVEKHQRQVAELLGEIKLLTSRLGITPAGALPDPTQQNNAMVLARGTGDVQAHKKALVKAKEETLPELFKKVEEEHRLVAMWMKAQLVPMKAQSKSLKTQTESIEDRIFAVELYAGLIEELTQIRKGEPAGNDEKIHLFQRRHYMDEECLLDYRAGGMEFKDLKAFDRWMMKKRNRERLLPMPKCVVAFQVRRRRKERNAASLQDFIHFVELYEMDKKTYLYIRNGDSYYRLSTGIDFGHDLFPDAENSYLLGGQLYIRDPGFHCEVASEAEYQDFLAREKERKEQYQAELAAWKKLTKAQKKKTHKPWYHGSSSFDQFEPLTPESVYYDDAMMKVAADARHHNRIAVVLQGLLDRSPAFHPHPPWRLWTPEGFQNGIELHHDDTRAITVGDPPDFEAYRAELNASIRKGTRTIGQQEAWLRAEADKENARQQSDWRIRSPINYKHFSPYGNDGPGLIAPVVSISRNGSTCRYTWERERLRPGWVSNPERPGWMKRDPSLIRCHFQCSSKLLLNVDAYRPGDFRQFYEDPRTRADYLKWAPLLLGAENFHTKRST